MLIRILLAKDHMIVRYAIHRKLTTPEGDTAGASIAPAYNVP
jgi:hypothetical protein